ncbi:peptide deformylase [Paenibacillus sp. UMB4589-SE434]|uniref:peptide deformylase n=1 Tax=Paenibacillus sp. UMB4589-SE434 TaxID=3046314 RepID=UPI002551B5F6|nr:peptide deformylase [Paenibacillus sp. UMB4589-SE434]MDK8182781.1 peptide deformylase [Paenibacillus sp. UMB4589-SE434]
MTVRTILPFGDPLLRKKCKPITEMTPRILTMLGDLKETLYADRGRAGLAAPQIGLLRRAVVLDVGEGYWELINPEIVDADGEQEGMEGCLSYPGYYGLVKRFERIKVRMMNRQLGEVTVEANGFLATCMQHELDHLDGVLFIDRMVSDYLVHESSHARISLLKVIELANQNVCHLK